MEAEAANSKAIEDVIEEERAKVDARTPITEEARPYRVRFRIGVSNNGHAGVCSEHACSDAGQLLLQGGFWLLTVHEILVEVGQVAHRYPRPWSAPLGLLLNLQAFGTEVELTCQSSYVPVYAASEF